MSDPRLELSNPATPPERLAELAQYHPELGSLIAAHPNAYPELQAWIAQYAQPAPAAPVTPEVAADPVTPAAYTDPAAHTDPAALGAQPAFTNQTAPTEPVVDPAAYTAPTAFGAAPATPKKRKKTALFVTLGAVLLVLLAVGGGVWWFFGSKLGGSASPEAAAKKLVTSVSNLDPLSLYGSLAPSEFDSFESAGQKLLDTQTDTDSRTAQEFIEKLKSEVTITTTEPLETTNTVIVEDAVERVTITDGVIEIDGDPETVAKTVIDFFGPLAEAQGEAYGYSMSKADLAEMQDSIEEDLADKLPYTIDFSDFDYGYEFSLVSVKEGNSWYVSPLLSFADYTHVSTGRSDAVLGNEIVAPAQNGAKTPEAAAENLTQAVFAGDYDAIVEQLPLPERRLLSIYGDSFADQMGVNPSDFRSAMDEYGLELEAASYTATNEDGAARLTVDRLAFTAERYDYWSELELTQRIEISGTCLTVAGESVNYVDYYTDDYDYLWDQYLDDDDYYSYSEWLSDHGYEEYETVESSDEYCATDSAPALDALGIEDWAIIAVQEDGDWKVSPIATVADISAIVTTRVNEAASDGKLDELFT